MQHLINKKYVLAIMVVLIVLLTAGCRNKNTAVDTSGTTTNTPSTVNSKSTSSTTIAPVVVDNGKKDDVSSDGVVDDGFFVSTDTNSLAEKKYVDNLKKSTNKSLYLDNTEVVSFIKTYFKHAATYNGDNIYSTYSYVKNNSSSSVYDMFVAGETKILPYDTDGLKEYFADGGRVTFVKVKNIKTFSQKEQATRLSFDLVIKAYDLEAEDKQSMVTTVIPLFVDINYQRTKLYVTAIN